MSEETFPRAKSLRQIEERLDTLEYNLKKNFDELNECLYELNLVPTYRLPNFRWNREVRK